MEALRPAGLDRQLAGIPAEGGAQDQQRGSRRPARSGQDRGPSEIAVSGLEFGRSAGARRASRRRATTEPTDRHYQPLLGIRRATYRKTTRMRTRRPGRWPGRRCTPGGSAADRPSTSADQPGVERISEEEVAGGFQVGLDDDTFREILDDPGRAFGIGRGRQGAIRILDDQGDRTLGDERLNRGDGLILALRVARTAEDPGSGKHSRVLRNESRADPERAKPSRRPSS